MRSLTGDGSASLARPVTVPSKGDFRYVAYETDTVALSQVLGEAESVRLARAADLDAAALDDAVDAHRGSSNNCWRCGKPANVVNAPCGHIAICTYAPPRERGHGARR